MKKLEQPRYLSLSEASRLLGVHSTTLRRWADAGTVPVYVTPGGHRRFAVADIEALCARTMLTANQALADTWARQALNQARTELQRVEQSPNWLAQFEDKERDIWRRMSMQLMGVVLRYVSAQDEDEALIEEARTLGATYAMYALRFNIPLSTALEAALFFRDSLIDAAMELPNRAHLPSQDTSRLLRRINHVLNAVQLAVATGYERQVR